MTPARLSDSPLPALPDRPVPPWPGARVDVDGAGLFVRRAPGPAGGGEPALFVHGLGGASTNWTDLMLLLAGRVDGAALDLPGFGWSDPPGDGRYRLDTHVRAVVRLLEVQGRGPVHLFGNSLGGAVSTRVAAERPDLVRSLTLVAPALPHLRPRRGSDPRLPLLLLPGVSGLVSRALAASPPEHRAQAVIDLCYYDPSRLPEERRREAVEEVVRRRGLAWHDTALQQSLRGLVAAYLDRGSRALWRQAASISAPTLLLWGRHDRLVDVALADRAARVWRDARTLVLEDCGHVPQLELPGTTARAVVGLLEDLPARAPVSPPRR